MTTIKPESSALQMKSLMEMEVLLSSIFDPAPKPVSICPTEEYAEVDIDSILGISSEHNFQYLFPMKTEAIYSLKDENRDLNPKNSFDQSEDILVRDHRVSVMCTHSNAVDIQQDAQTFLDDFCKSVDTVWNFSNLEKNEEDDDALYEDIPRIQTLNTHVEEINLTQDCNSSIRIGIPKIEKKSFKKSCIQKNHTQKNISSISKPKRIRPSRARSFSVIEVFCFECRVQFKRPQSLISHLMHRHGKRTQSNLNLNRI